MLSSICLMLCVKTIGASRDCWWGFTLFFFWAFHREPNICAFQDNLLENESSEEPPGSCKEQSRCSSEILLCIPVPHMTNDHSSQISYYTWKQPDSVHTAVWLSQYACKYCRCVLSALYVQERELVARTNSPCRVHVCACMCQDTRINAASIQRYLSTLSCIWQYSCASACKLKSVFIHFAQIGLWCFFAHNQHIDVSSL